MRYYQITVRLPNGSTQTFFVQATSEAEAQRRGRQFGVGDIEDSGAAVVTVDGVQDGLPENATVFNSQGQNIGSRAFNTGAFSQEGDSGQLRQDFLEQFLPDFTSAFVQGRQAVGRALPNIDITGGFGRSAANLLATPLTSLRNIQTAINQQRAPLELTGNPFQQAAQTFQNLVGMGRNPDNPFLSELQNPQLGVGTGVSRNPFAIEAEQLARGAARNRFGSLFANRFLPTSAQVLQDFQESEGFGRENTFLPFLQQRFGLG